MSFFAVVYSSSVTYSSPSLPSPGTVLYGVEQIIKEATNHLLANFIIHSQDQVVHGCRSTLVEIFVLLTDLHALVSSILVTGRSGVGRTSVAREIARRLEEDTRTYACQDFISFLPSMAC